MLDNGGSKHWLRTFGIFYEDCYTDIAHFSLQYLFAMINKILPFPPTSDEINVKSDKQKTLYRVLEIPFKNSSFVWLPWQFFSAF